MLPLLPSPSLHDHSTLSTPCTCLVCRREECGSCTSCSTAGAPSRKRDEHSQPDQTRPKQTTKSSPLKYTHSSTPYLTRFRLTRTTQPCHQHNIQSNTSKHAPAQLHCRKTARIITRASRQAAAACQAQSAGQSPHSQHQISCISSCIRIATTRCVPSSIVLQEPLVCVAGYPTSDGRGHCAPPVPLWTLCKTSNTQSRATCCCNKAYKATSTHPCKQCLQVKHPAAKRTAPAATMLL